MASHESDRLSQHVTRTRERYAQRYGGSARWVVTAPGRVNLIGEHTDYNGGLVLPMAIERRVVIAAGPTHDAGPGLARVYSANVDEQVAFGLDDNTGASGGSEPGWARYVRGALRLMAKAGAVVRDGFDAVIESDVPIGGGLSSSAALAVATATLVEAMTGVTLPPLDKARLCQRVEHEYAGVPCGIMDQYVSVAARADHALLLDCHTMRAEPIAMRDPAVAVLIANTGVHHALADGAYAARRAACARAAEAMGVTHLGAATIDRLDTLRDRAASDDDHDDVDMLVRRARHVITECDRTRRAAGAIARGDWSSVGALMHASHRSLRDDYEVSCEELDAMVDIAMAIGADGGVYGSRMTGGGFGGCTVSLVRTDRADAIAHELGERYRARTEITADVFVTRAAGGAAIVPTPRVPSRP